MLQLHLRAEQLMLLGDARERDFRRRLVEHVRSHFAPHLARVADAELERRVEAGIRRARGHLLSSERAIAGFVSLMFVLGPELDRHPEVARALDALDRKDDQRLSALPGMMTPEAWQDVRQCSRATAWKRVH